MNDDRLLHGTLIPLPFTLRALSTGVGDSSASVSRQVKVPTKLLAFWLDRTFRYTASTGSIKVWVEVKVESVSKSITCTFLSQVMEFTGRPVDVQTRFVASLNDRSLIIIEGSGERE